MGPSYKSRLGTEPARSTSCFVHFFDQFQMAASMLSVLTTPSFNEDLASLKVEDGSRSPIARGILTQPSRYIKRGALALIPSPIRRHLAPHPSKTPRLQPTSYLDGLRGLASFIVFAHHYTCEYVYPYVAYYGVNAEKVPSSPLQLPFIRVVYAGRPMVHIFFVISGFVLSKKPLELARAHDYDKLLTTCKVFPNLSPCV